MCEGERESGHLCRLVKLVHRGLRPGVSVGGTLTCEAGYVVDDETRGQKPP